MRKPSRVLIRKSGEVVITVPQFLRPDHRADYFNNASEQKSSTRELWTNAGLKKVLVKNRNTVGMVLENGDECCGRTNCQ
jgi:hypothetical protein